MNKTPLFRIVCFCLLSAAICAALSSIPMVGKLFAILTLILLVIAGISLIGWIFRSLFH